MTTPPPVPSAKSDAAGLALGSMICGILGFLTCGLTGLVAIILGHMAIARARRAGESAGGQAVAGLIMGYLTLVIGGIAVLAGLSAPLILRQKHTAERTRVAVEMKELGARLAGFESEFGQFPSDETASRVAGGTESGLPLIGADVLNQLKAFDASGEALPTVPGSADGNWLYRPDPAEPPSEVILISPKIGGKRLSLAADATVTTMDGEPDPAGFVEIPPNRE